MLDDCAHTRSEARMRTFAHAQQSLYSVPADLDKALLTVGHECVRRPLECQINLRLGYVDTCTDNMSPVYLFRIRVYTLTVRAYANMTTIRSNMR